MHMLELLSLSVWSHSCSLSHSTELVDQGYNNLLDKPKLHWSFNNTVVESTETLNHNGMIAPYFDLQPPGSSAKTFTEWDIAL